MGIRSILFAALFCIASSAPAGAEVIQFEVENYSPRRAWIDLPDGAKGPVPLVVLVHSFTGTDQRENVMGKALRKAGYATALPDLRSGVYASEADSPGIRTLGAMTRRLVAALRSDPRFDPKKIAIVGFSQGGDIGLILAQGPGLAAVVSYYTGCVNRGTAVAVPVQIHLGGKDVATATREECQTLVDTYNTASPGIGEFYLYEGVYHAFNNPDATTLGGTRIVRGQKLLTQYNAKATELAQQRTFEFLAKQFANQP